ncbi:uncharacterized protein P174DRAFT_153823 [Aspergillus novofumigatus IBT 16806]|uniref:Uncharacterized protein n=1 Tax=Aspergillus novofumigatus (strain IBT 16806) TaxID=1392255 RepID=A0A2I1CEU4_ASPN1|nr:uncharacterized protein P174DRAFT_153823 [Aspergillus novofumigatus IBT 16806]PKX96145.1 hypothetical protein P174DRAFT_153823 [Aspergillus novofumigatus IBT 16806]
MLRSKDFCISLLLSMERRPPPTATTIPPSLSKRGVVLRKVRRRGLIGANTYGLRKPSIMKESEAIALKVVILVKWTRLQRARVSGLVSFSSEIGMVLPALQQIEVIFPRPPTTNNQRFRIRRWDLFGPSLLPGHNGIEFGSPGDSITACRLTIYLVMRWRMANATAAPATSVPDA